MSEMSGLAATVASADYEFLHPGERAGRPSAMSAALAF